MIIIKKTGSMRRKVSKNHPYKSHAPGLFTNHSEAYNRYMNEGYNERLIRKMKKKGTGPLLQPV
jgi:hypothetical protein